jgi:hypothetical protein
MKLSLKSTALVALVVLIEAAVFVWLMCKYLEGVTLVGF